MVDNPEQEPKTPELGIRPEDIEVPPHIEKAGVKPTPNQFTGQVTDDSDQPVIQTPQAKTVTIQVPANQATLAGWAKGKPFQSLTWFALFWLRLIKKAWHFGWKVVTGKKLADKNSK